MHKALTAAFAVAALCAAVANTSFAQDKAPATGASQPDAAPAATASSPASSSASSAPAAPPAVDTLKIIDTKVGTGKEAQVGKAAMVQYTGWLYDDNAQDKKGKEFDSSARRQGLPLGFVVGVGRVIKGWDQGIIGMKVGGTRTLIIPAALAYGDKDIGNGLIPPNSALVFDLELVEVRP
jgi:FKBP-type peptidyl-prolyl cis-trans isomerase FkpA